LERSGTEGITVRDFQVVALCRFETAVQRVFAVILTPRRRCPDLIYDDERPLQDSFVVRDPVLADVSPALRVPAEPAHRAAGPKGNGSMPRVPVVKA
jgi:hypothetical protein